MNLEIYALMPTAIAEFANTLSNAILRSVRQICDEKFPLVSENTSPYNRSGLNGF